MCGRYQVGTEEDILEMREILQELNRKYADMPAHAQMRTGEISPTNYAPVIADDGPVIMRWGFPMHGSKSQAIINARSESAYERPMFRNALLSRRVVIPTTGFYEWSHDARGKSVDKFLFRIPGDRMLYLAGMYTDFNLPTGKERRFTILTTSANGSMRSYHNRMPVYVAAGERDAWIHDPASVGEILYRRQPELSAVKVVVGGQIDEGDQLGFL